ncbi:hypothetical protein IT41_08195 [Paracoccus halophilus]|uniref:Uncharacterized protein n=1 Tax=Paracoccus halophilus TaxID=376733 RepID=A0A099F4B5_9RHOB|nr:hypothetical protein [Paracoccus halophilus]KGJ04992.1 hypothetical protein IT41_08195 [Paracoccus halophilus]
MDFGKTSGEMIQARLETLIRQIEAVGYGATTSYWVGDVVTERQLKDDLASGRTHWTTALARARSGIRALDDENYDLALDYLLEANSLAIAALGLRLSRVREQEGLKLLAKPAKRRGRPKKALD